MTDVFGVESCFVLCCFVVDYLAQVFDVLKTDLKDDVVSVFSCCSDLR